MLANGKYPGSQPPYGYKKKKIVNDKGWTLEIIPEQALVVKTIYDLYVNKHMRPIDIAKYLDKLHYKPSKSDSWSPNSIRDMLSNPIYIGKMRWKQRKIVKSLKDGKIKNTQPKNKTGDVILVDGLHEAIIDEETYNAAQQHKTDKAPSIPEYYTLQNPLTTLVRCAKCNRLMSRRHCKYGDILCCVSSKCDNVSSKIELVEKKILQSLELWLEDFEIEINSIELTKNNNNIIDIKQATLKEITSDIKSCQSKLNRVYDFFENGVYALDEFTQRKNKIITEEKELKDTYDKLIAELNEYEKNDKAKKELIPRAQYVLESYNKCDDVQTKNELLKSVIEKVEYLKTEKCYGKNTDPENFELLIYPKF